MRWNYILRWKHNLPLTLCFLTLISSNSLLPFSVTSVSSPTLLSNYSPSQFMETLFSPTRRGWWGMWSSRAALAGVTMTWWNAEVLGQWKGCTASSLPQTSGEQTLASPGISLVECHGIRSRREEGPSKAGHYSRITPQEWCIQKEKARQKHQQACVDRQGASGKTQTLKGSPQRGGSKDRKPGRDTEKLSELPGSG